MATEQPVSAKLMATTACAELWPINMPIKINIKAAKGSKKSTRCALDWLAEWVLGVAKERGANIKMALAIIKALINHVIRKSPTNLIDNHYHLG
jgi:hypothetical protein